MRYLKLREDFLNFNYKPQKGDKSVILEAFENDISWGSSLLGRLINSTIRKSKIYFNATRIKPIVDRIKIELDSLVESYLDEEDKKKVAAIKVRFLLEALVKAVNNNEPLEVFLGRDKQKGLIDTTIDEVKKVEIDEKDILIQKLEKFRSDLLEIQGKDEDEVNNNDDLDGIIDGDSETAKKFFIESNKLFKSIISINTHIKNKSIKFKDGENLIETNFDLNKFNNLKNELDKTTNSNKSKKLSLLNQIIPLIKLGLKTYQSKNDKGNINLFNGYLNKYNSLRSNLGVVNKEPKKSNIHVQLPKKEYVTESENIRNYVNDSEKDAKNAWNKVIKYYNSSGIGKYIPEMENLLNTTISEGKEKYKFAKKKLVDITRQVVKNKSTVGKPIGFDMLIKEDASVNDISKSISILGSMILSFKDDIGLLGSYLEVGNQMKQFIKSFDTLDSLLPKLENRKIHTFDNFSLIREDDNTDSDIQSELDTLNSDSSDTNKIKKAWDNNFTKEDETKWKVNEEDAKKVGKEIENKGFDINTSNPDPIIRIVNLFGQAYKIYSTPTIPSGRPNGRVSSKTYRQYKYLGKGSPGGFDNPGYGPWAVVNLYQTFRNGVMELLSNTLYRKLLASPKVKINGKDGGGVILTKFMNDMLEPAAEYDTIRHELVKKYFKIDDTVLKDKITPSYPTQEGKKVDKDDVDPDYLRWFVKSSYSKKELIDNEKSFIFLKGKELVGKDGKKPKDLNLYGQIYKIEGDNLIVKFQFSCDEIPFYYLKGTGKTYERIKNASNNKPVYIGLINLDKNAIISSSKKIKISYMDVSLKTNDVKVEEILMDKQVPIMYIGNYNDDLELNCYVPKDNPKSRPSGDRQIESKDFLNQLKSKL